MNTKALSFVETGNLRETEKSILFAWLRENPESTISRRGVAGIIGKETTHATRVVADFLRDGILKHSHDERCPKTGKMVQYLQYSGIAYEPQRKGSRDDTGKSEPKPEPKPRLMVVTQHKIPFET